MSFVIAEPEFVKAAAGQLAGLQSSLSAAAESAAAPTTGIAAAAADEISASISRLFGTYGEEFQAVNAQAQAFNAEFVRALNGGAAAYVNAEIANAERTLLSAALAGGIGTAAPAEPLGDLLGGLLGGGTGGGGGGTGGGGGLLGGLSGFLGPQGTQVLNGTLANLLTGPQGLGGLVGPQLGSILQNLLLGPPPDPNVPPYTNPYQTLYENTNRNLVNLGAGYRPFPVLNQLGINMGHYAELAANDFATNLRGFPDNVPANLEYSVTGGSPANLEAGVRQFVGGTTGFYSKIGKLGADLSAGLQGTLAEFPEDLGKAQDAIGRAQYQEAVRHLARGTIDLFMTGFDTSGLEISYPLPSINIAGPVGVTGPAASLLPILTAVGEQVTGTASTFPANSIPGMMIRDFARGVGVLTDSSVSADFNLTLGLPPTLVGEAVFGLPLQLGFGLIGPVFGGFGGLAEGGEAFSTAMLNGNLLGAANAVGNTPAYFLDGFLNGQVFLDQPLDVRVEVLPGVPVTLPTIAKLPLSGLLVTPENVVAVVPLSKLGFLDLGPLPGLGILPDITVPVGGTKFGGLMHLLLNGVPQDFARGLSYQNNVA